MLQIDPVHPGLHPKQYPVVKSAVSTVNGTGYSTTTAVRFLCRSIDEEYVNLVQQIKSVYGHGRIFHFVMQASNLVHVLSKHS